MWAGTYRDTRGYVWARSFDDAFEKWVEYLDTLPNAKLFFVKLDVNDLKRAAEDEGIQWRAHWPDFDDEKFQRVVEAAEADLTSIGHTQLDHGSYIASDEWGGDEINDPEEWARVEAYSLHKYRREYGEDPP
jgi:hypothetical protein